LSVTWSDGVRLEVRGCQVSAGGILVAIQSGAPGIMSS